MSTFTPEEVTYLQSQRLARLATIGPDGRPHVTPVGVRYDAARDAVVVGGHGFARTKKFRDAQQNPEVAYVVDDLASVDPWSPRGIEIRGRAEVHAGGNADGALLVIRPRRIRSWGLDSGPFEVRARDVGQDGRRLRARAPRASGS